MECPICKKLGLNINSNGFIKCNFYDEPIHQVHCTGNYEGGEACQYHSLKYSNDWCRARHNHRKYF